MEQPVESQMVRGGKMQTTVESVGGIQRGVILLVKQNGI